MCLIDAFALISEKYREVNLIIAGEGEFHSELERHINENRLEQRVLLTGKVDSTKRGWPDRRQFICRYAFPS